MQWRRLLILFLLLVTGCSPLGFPMVRRLDPDQQRQLDSAWDAMLTPAKRLDRQTLLDCVVMMQLYESGVDRFSAKSTKQTSAGKVEMTIEFDRSKPQSDQFTLKLLGPWGQTLRRETWSEKELLDQFYIDYAATSLKREHEDQTEFERRMQRFTAATQPAR